MWYPVDDDRFGGFGVKQEHLNPTQPVKVGGWMQCDALRALDRVRYYVDDGADE